MDHPHDDEILKHLLDQLADVERRELQTHVEGCAACRARMDEISADLSGLGGLRAESSTDYPAFIPHRSSPISRSWLRMAAILVLGFCGGVAAARFWQSEPIVVEPMPRPIFPPRSALTMPVIALEDALQTLTRP
jgi:anti-sigma factor RsiW